MTKIQKKAVWQAIGYILRATQRQGYLMPVRDLYGDGTKFKPLTFIGFANVYEETKQSLKEKGISV